MSRRVRKTAKRTPFRPTVEQREAVLILAGAQIDREIIAEKLGMTVGVLKKHFAAELKAGPHKCEADVIQSLFYAAKAGNVAAAKVYLLFRERRLDEHMDDALARRLGEIAKAVGSRCRSNADLAVHGLLLWKVLEAHGFCLSYRSPTS